MGHKDSKSELSRTIGLSAATSIGVGTMVGAGIFVFPGIAGGLAGPAAILSFLIAGLVALLVAACTAELATAMPKSGGGYFFVSRTFGPLWGILIGLAQWVGLIFACSFYLVGFGEYTIELFKEMELSGSAYPQAFAGIACFFLLILNILGTKKVGRFQNLIVILLTFLLVIIFSYGFIKLMGGSESSNAVKEFFPRGKLSVFTTAALIFTSYLGFVQISTVAGEVRSPSKNLPRALMGSVLIVVALYAFVLFVTTSLYSTEELSKLGEAATLEVARKLVGEWGAVIVLFSGLLATLSSANASIMSSSRSLFALSEDRLVSKRVSAVNQQFGTPHISLILISIPIGVLLFRSDLELFAEVASFLHLLIYAAICTALFKLRLKPPSWFQPSFKVPFGKVVAIVGGLACIGLIFFMQSLSIIIGFSIMLLALAYYYFFKKGIDLPEFKGREEAPPKVIERMLVPLEYSEDELDDLPQELIDVLSASRLMILAYELIPEQADPEQSDDKDEEKVERKLREKLHSIDELKIEMVKTQDLDESINRAIEEYQCNAILWPKPIRKLERLLIPLYDEKQLNSDLRKLISEMGQDAEVEILLVAIYDEDEQEHEESSQLAWEEKVKSWSENVDFEIELDSRNTERSQQSPKQILKFMSSDTDLVLLSRMESDEDDAQAHGLNQEFLEEIEGPFILILGNADGKQDEEESE